MRATPTGPPGLAVQASSFSVTFGKPKTSQRNAERHGES